MRRRNQGIRQDYRQEETKTSLSNLNLSTIAKNMNTDLNNSISGLLQTTHASGKQQKKRKYPFNEQNDSICNANDQTTRIQIVTNDDEECKVWLESTVTTRNRNKKLRLNPDSKANDTYK